MSKYGEHDLLRRILKGRSTYEDADTFRYYTSRQQKPYKRRLRNEFGWTEIELDAEEFRRSIAPHEY